METRSFSFKKTFQHPSEIDLFLALYALANTNPKKARQGIEALQKKYPNAPHILNLLASVHFSLGHLRKGNRLVEENYRKNSDSLFAKINFADLCLRRKKAQNIPEIFNQMFSLPALYPDRNMFHVCEFRGFMVLMGLYHLYMKKRAVAEEYHFFAAYVDPNHPGTQLLGKKLYAPSFFKRVFSRFFNQ